MNANILIYEYLYVLIYIKAYYMFKYICIYNIVHIFEYMR